MATGPHPNIMNWYRAKSEVGSEHIQHVHLKTPDTAQDRLPSNPEDMAEPSNMKIINRLGDFARRVTAAEDVT